MRQLLLMKEVIQTYPLQLLLLLVLLMLMILVMLMLMIRMIFDHMLLTFMTGSTSITSMMEMMVLWLRHWLQHEYSGWR